MPYGAIGAAPTIVDEVTKRYEDWWYMLGSAGAYAHQYRIITTQQYRRTCLTQAAALGGLASGVVLDTYSKTTKSARRISVDGQFQLQVTRDSWTAWVTDTFAPDT